MYCCAMLPESSERLFALRVQLFISTKSSTAGCSSDKTLRVFTITHPFHPLLGEEFVLATRRLNWGEDRVMYHDQEGKLQSMPTSWTSEADKDQFTEVSAGSCWFRIDDLKELVSLLHTIRADRKIRSRGVK